MSSSSVRSPSQRRSTRNASGASRSSSRPRAVDSISRTIIDDGYSRKRSSSSHSNRVVLNPNFTSKIEAAILNSSRPIDIEATEEVTVHGQTGFLTNRTEIHNWVGEVPITDYKINEDCDPEVIRKQTDQVLQYEQEIAVRYLRPPTPPPPGEIHIVLEKNYPTAPAPPLVIRQQPPRPETPCPLVIREAPPKPPSTVGQKIITISGKRIPPAPRKVVVERLPPLPSKPQSVIIERWLPYKDQKRRVIFTRPCEPDPIVQKPKNVIIQWEQPRVDIHKVFKDLGIARANPNEYVRMYGHEIKESTELPSFVHDIRPPSGILLAAEHSCLTPSIELEGDLEALRLIDLEKEGLGEYRSLVERLDTRKSVATPRRRESEDTVYANVRATPIPKGQTPVNLDYSQRIESRPQSTVYQTTEFVASVERAASRQLASSSSRQQSVRSTSSRPQSLSRQVEEPKSVSRHESKSSRPQSTVREQTSSRHESKSSRPQSTVREQTSSRHESKSSRPQSRHQTAQQVEEVVNVSRHQSARSSASRAQSTHSLVQALEEQNLIERSSTGSRTPSQVGSPVVATIQSPIFFARSPVPTIDSERAPSRRSTSRSPARQSSLYSASQFNTSRAEYSPLVERSERSSPQLRQSHRSTSRVSHSTVKNESVSYLNTTQTYLEPSASEIKPSSPVISKNNTFFSTDSVFERDYKN